MNQAFASLVFLCASSVNNFFSQRREEEQKALRTDVDSCLRSAYLFDGGDDAVISAAATDVAAHALAHAESRRTTFLQQSDRRHNLSRCAVAALEAVVLDEGCLNGMQLVAMC